jgi:4-aminobutyrate aminotransferase-like enzyme
MPRQNGKSGKPLLDSPRIREAARALIDAVHEETRDRELAPKVYERALRDLERLRGRPLFHKAVASGVGRGARVRLANGHTVLDLASGIGTYGFGHSDSDLLEHAVVAAAGDAVFQGHLLPGTEYLQLSKALVRHSGSRLKHVWLSVSGAVANENAQKIIFQKHAPADMVVAFERCFAGRTLAMAEITDKPAYRQGLPLRGNVLYVPFFDPTDPKSTEKSVEVLNDHLSRYPGRIATMMFELVQGEGGFHTAPREFFGGVIDGRHAAVRAAPARRQRGGRPDPRQLVSMVRLHR